MKGVGIIKNLRQAFVRENEVIKFENSLSGGPDWTRTNDFHHVKVTLYQLSYGAKKETAVYQKNLSIASKF